MFDQRSIGNTSLQSTIFGMGGTGIGNIYTAVTHDDAWTAMDTAWTQGVRFFDTAPFYGYGLSERRLGDFLRDKPSDDYVLSTKVGRMLRPGPRNDPEDGFESPMPFYVEYDYTYDGAMRSFEDSLQRLGLDHIHVALIQDIDLYTHGPETQPKMYATAMEGAYKALAKLRDEGLVSAIGMGLNDAEVCEAALRDADPDCFLLAGRYTLLEQGALDSFLPLCAERNVSIFLGGVFNSGLLVDPYADSVTYNYTAAPKEIIDQARAIGDICKQHNVPTAAAALQFPLGHSAISCVLSGARSAREINEIADWLSHPIPDALWKDLRAAGLLHTDAPTG